MDLSCYCIFFPLDMKDEFLHFISTFHRFDFLVFVISMERDILYDRINQRVDNMIEQGLIQEVENLLKKYATFPTAMQGLGYKEVVSYFQGNNTKEEKIEKKLEENLQKFTRKFIESRG